MEMTSQTSKLRRKLFKEKAVKWSRTEVISSEPKILNEAPRGANYQPNLQIGAFAAPKGSSVPRPEAESLQNKHRRRDVRC